MNALIATPTQSSKAESSPRKNATRKGRKARVKDDDASFEPEETPPRRSSPRKSSKGESMRVDGDDDEGGKRSKKDTELDKDVGGDGYAQGQEEEEDRP
jgi:hypothetical protein